MMQITFSDEATSETVLSVLGKLLGWAVNVVPVEGEDLEAELSDVNPRNGDVLVDTRRGPVILNVEKIARIEIL